MGSQSGVDFLVYQFWLTAKRLAIFPDLLFNCGVVPLRPSGEQSCSGPFVARNNDPNVCLLVCLFVLFVCFVCLFCLFVCLFVCLCVSAEPSSFCNCFESITRVCQHVQLNHSRFGRNLAI